MSTLELYSPLDLRDALRYIENEDRQVTVIASGTDLLPRMRRMKTAPSTLLDISSFKEDLRYIRQSDGVIRLGALTTVTDLLESPIFGGRLSIIREASELFGAPQIRNVATIGGNVCSASSSEDLIPVFMVLGARVTLVSARGDRTLSLQDFVVGKRETAMKSSEILAEVLFEAPKARSWTAYEKLGRRNMLIIALVNEALSLTMEEDLLTVRSAKLALNRVAGKIPALAPRTGEFLSGRKVTEETVREAEKVLASELALTSDFRASASYRNEVARAYLRRLIQRCHSRIQESS